MPKYLMVPYAQLVEPVMPARFEMDEQALIDLANNIKVNGILQPLLIVPATISQDGDNSTEGEGTPAGSETPAPSYEIVAGHRRYKSAGICQLEEVPCLLFDDKEIALHAARLAENCYREDLTPAEEAVYYDDLIKKYDLTEEQLLAQVRQSKEYIYARLDLLNGNEDVFNALRKREISMSVAKALNKCKDKNHCHYLLQLAIQGGATARTVSAWVSNFTAGQTATTSPAPIVEAAAPAAVIVSDDRVCYLCRNGKNPLGLVVVWVHEQCRQQFNQNLEDAATIPAGENINEQ